MNWDASVNETMGLIGIGAIIRNCNGLVHGTLRARRNLRISPFTAEAYAMLLAV